MALKISDVAANPALKRMAQTADTDKSGTVTKQEFKALEKKVEARTRKPTEEAEAAFGGLKKLVMDDVAPAKVLKALEDTSARGGRSNALAVRTGKAGGPAKVDGDARAGDLSRLNETQRAVMKDVEAKAAQRSKAARPALETRVKSLGYTVAQLDKALEYIKTSAPTTINFSPDKALRQQTSAYGAAATMKYEVKVDREKSRLIDAFAVDGHYKNQFETGITSGSSSAYPGGSRDGWEKNIFEGGYHKHDLIPAERPKYGALNAGQYANSTASHYGSCYFELKAEARSRITFTAGNSSGKQAKDVGTAQHFQHVLLAVDEPQFRQIMDVANGKAAGGPSTSWQYIEAQVHGPVEFHTDLDTVVINTSFKGTEYEKKLREFADANDLAIKWHDGKTVTKDKG